MRHAATLRRLVRCVFTRAHECIWGGSGERGSPLRSSSSYFQRAIIKGKAGRERCARVKGKGINYCRVPGEICKLNSARARERGGGGKGIFLFSPLSPPLDAARFDGGHTALLITPDWFPRIFPPRLKFSQETKELRQLLVNSSGVLFFFSFFFVGMR